DGFAQGRIAEMVAVAEQQLVEGSDPAAGPELDAQVGEAAVGDRALREVVGDRVVAQLFRRLDFDGHSSIAHVRKPCISVSPSVARDANICSCRATQRSSTPISTRSTRPSSRETIRAYAVDP